uniref:Serine/threonine-protein phosphatase 4 regulatory subunit 3-like isoform X4 n=1 Tax=Hirondellea gigas TaxID=1518452 RepID=A0A6A7G426_9CRUS
MSSTLDDSSNFSKEDDGSSNAPQELDGSQLPDESDPLAKPATPSASQIFMNGGSSEAEKSEEVNLEAYLVEGTPVASSSTPVADEIPTGSSQLAETMADENPVSEESNQELEANSDVNSDADSGADIPGFRVKIYTLSEEGGTWDDLGFVGRLTWLHDANGIAIKVVDESTGEVLKDHRVSDCIDYERQGETIITWVEEALPDIALSFQESEACDAVYKLLNSFQHNSMDTESELDPDPETALPKPTISCLKEIQMLIANGSLRHSVVSQLLSGGFIEDLFDIHCQLEDFVTSMDDLDTLFDIFKTIILFNDASLLERLLDVQHTLESVIAVLEYAPGRPTSGEPSRKHRDFLQRSKLQMPLPLPYPELVQLTYTLRYFRDVVFLRFLDDVTAMTLNAMISVKESLIIRGLFDESWIATFLLKLQGKSELSSIPENSCSSPSIEDRASPSIDDLASPSIEDRASLFRFFGEYISIVKRFDEKEEKERFFDSILETSLFEMLESVCNEADPVRHEWVWLILADAMDFLMTARPDAFRTFALSSPQHDDEMVVAEDLRIIGRLIDVLILNDPKMDIGILFQISAILQKSLEVDPSQRLIISPYLERFYPLQIRKLSMGLSVDGDSDVSTEVRYQCCELLIVCVKQHRFRSLFPLLIGCLLKVLHLAKRPNMRILLCVIRFMRVCIDLREDPVDKSIVSHDCFAPIIGLFQANGKRYNILNSTMIELFEFIRSSNIKRLVEYIVLKHIDKFAVVDYVSTFKDLSYCYQQNKQRHALGADSMGSNSDSCGSGSRTKNSIGDEIEEAYFSDSDDDDNKMTTLNDAENTTPDAMAVDSEFIERKKSTDSEPEIDLCSLGNKTALRKRIDGRGFFGRGGFNFKKRKPTIQISLTSMPSPNSSPSIRTAHLSRSPPSPKSPPSRFTLSNSPERARKPEFPRSSSPPLSPRQSQRQKSIIAAPKPVKSLSPTRDGLNFPPGINHVEFTAGGLLHSPLDSLNDGPVLPSHSDCKSPSKRRRLSMDSNTSDQSQNSVSERMNGLLVRTNSFVLHQ